MCLKFVGVGTRLDLLANGFSWNRNQTPESLYKSVLIYGLNQSATYALVQMVWVCSWPSPDL